MARIEEQRLQPPIKNHSFFRGLFKTLKLLIAIPFKISFRILFIILAFIALIQICRMGVLTVPVISPIFFREPHPIRVVESGAMSDQLLLLRMQESLQSSSIQHPSTSLTESELTALLQNDKLSISGPFSSVQVALTTGHMELFGTLRTNEKVKIKAWIVPSVVQAKPQAKIQRAWIGNVTVPQWLLSQGVTDFFTTTGFNAMMPKLPLSSIDLDEKKMTLSL